MRDDETRDRETRDDYLWDGSGPPDPEVQQLERLLGALRHDPATPLARDRVAPSGAEVVDLHARLAEREMRRPRRVLRVAIAAALLAGVAAALVAHRVSRSAWEVVRVAGGVARTGAETLGGPPAGAGSIAGSRPFWSAGTPAVRTVAACSARSKAKATVAAIPRWPAIPSACARLRNSGAPAGASRHSRLRARGLQLARAPAHRASGTVRAAE